ncbi:PREDICTED: uncharacterized protein LOC101306133 [Fragaria vesca subsp. vesca]
MTLIGLRQPLTELWGPLTGLWGLMIGLQGQLTGLLGSLTGLCPREAFGKRGSLVCKHSISGRTRPTQLRRTEPDRHIFCLLGGYSEQLSPLSTIYPFISSSPPQKILLNLKSLRVRFSIGDEAHFWTMDRARRTSRKGLEGLFCRWQIPYDFSKS